MRIDPTGMFWDELKNWVKGNGWNATDNNRAAQGYATTVGTGMVKDSAARAKYVNAASQLAKTDHAGRNAVIAEARAASTPVGANLAEVMKPTSTLPQYAGGTASKTSAAVNEGMATAGVVGKGLLAVGVTISVVNVATAPEGEKGRAASKEVGGWTGALAFGAVGAKGGAVAGGAIGVWFFGAGAAPGAAIGATIGGIGGGIFEAFAGQKAGENVHDMVTGN